MNTVFVCSNEYCGVIWNADPRGHCPACKKADGSGWSTMSTEVRSLPKPPSSDLVDYGYAPGGYIINCRDCKAQVWGCDKRAAVCKPCAEKRRDKALGAPVTTACQHDKTKPNPTLVPLGSAAHGSSDWLWACSVCDDRFRMPVGTAETTGES